MLHGAFDTTIIVIITDIVIKQEPDDILGKRDEDKTNKHAELRASRHLREGEHIDTKCAYCDSNLVLAVDLGKHSEDNLDDQEDVSKSEPRDRSIAGLSGKTFCCLIELGLVLFLLLMILGITITLFL